MITPKYPQNEAQRLAAVKSYGLLDTLEEEDYDNITRLAANFCNTPISLVTLLDTDRNFLKSHHGISLDEAPRNESFCGHAILEKNAIFIVEDAKKDIRFEDNPTVTELGMQFYAGVPIIDAAGYALGTLCIYDTKPRKLTEEQKTTLILLAKQVVKLFELNKSNLQLTATKSLLEERNNNLKQFAGLVSHDLKSPLANITSLSRLLKDEYMVKFDQQGVDYLDYIEESSDHLRDYIDGMLLFYKSDELVKENHYEIPVATIFDDIDEMLFVDHSVFKYTQTPATITVNKAALTQILLNLVGNALKYNHEEIPLVEVKFSQNKNYYIFSVIDNGNGIEKDKQELIFEIFKTVDEKDRNGKKGSGIGLATVKNLVTKLGGTISVSSEIGKGSTFTFTIKKV
ncbi:sensor histidine kinase [Patiriisocius marinistellae]|uniref:histidine kinase n=1 Tax=Patiriisocius marinistellae TaxID=2494560 RepID=A0A5J4G1G3_9FLAO|nr:GAF domain-containing sensor histidine kinase [Patiriisocius marinistellae]GEQ86479.1 sensor histidine kinase [Patiriisocius marinistellae]